MIKENKIRELVFDKVVTLLDQELNKFGFKYQKSKNYFLRKERGFNHIIAVYTPYSPISYDESTDQLHLTFHVSSQLEMPEYEKWSFEKLGEKPHFSVRSKNLISQIELLFSDFDEGSFYEPTASQQFKSNVTLSLMGGSNQPQDMIPINDLLAINIPGLVSDLTEKSDILKLHHSREFPYQYMFLLVYGGYKDIAEEELKKYFNYLVNEIESKLKVSETEASRLIEELNSFIKNSQKVSGLSFANPFKRSIKVLESKNDKFEFSPKTKFNETQRLDISQYDIKSVHINPVGDILFYTDDQKIIKLNSKGEQVFEKDLETPKGFDKIFWEVPSGVVKGTHNFYVNNYIITSDNEFLELPLPTKILKKGKLQNPHIIDFAFDAIANTYLILYEGNLLVYDKDGKAVKTINTGPHYGSRIIIEKKWIVTQQRDTANIILNFAGETIGTYEFGNGNNYYEFSPNYEYLICFFYSTKSQFHNLANGTKGTLWAHPTFIKDYKEIMYNDINHNFGMSKAKFSPDNKYIVGGAEHGKYVAWNLPKLDRIELIPQPEMINILKPQITTRFSGNTSEDIITRAELVNLDNQTFLKNRGNDISKIIFFENGDIFITELGYGAFVLAWDRTFNNLQHYKLEGKLDLHSQKYLTQRSKTEFIIYEPK